MEHAKAGRSARFVSLSFWDTADAARTISAHVVIEKLPIRSNCTRFIYSPASLIDATVAAVTAAEDLAR
jgi:hypothetical protein